VAAAAGLGLLAGPMAMTTGASALPGSAAPTVVSAGSPQAAAFVTTKKKKPAKKKSKKPRRRIALNLLALNDFHGQLEKVPTSSSSGRVGDVAAGGAEYLATHLKMLRQQSARRGAATLTVAAGDLIGATPLLSAAFHDEPTVEAMNKVGLDISSVGNHEFDEGWRELLRIQRGGCLADGPDGADNQNSCPDGKRFRGADYDYLAANVKNNRTGKTVLPGVEVRKVKGKKVAFIGMTLQDTPNIVTAEAVAGLTFTDEVRTVNKLVPKLRKRGIQAMVVLLHEGGAPGDQFNPSACDGVTGPGMDIARNLHPEIDAVVSGHTHQPYVCTVRDPLNRKRLITSAYSVGRVVTEVQLKINRRNGDIARHRTRAVNHVITNEDVPAAQVITDLISSYKALVARIEIEVLGQLAPADSQNSLARPGSVTEDYELGNLIADSQKNDPSAVPAGGTEPVIAFMNPGGIRADLAENADGDVTYGAAFSTQPFNNYVVSYDLTGQQILDVLNEQWNGANEESNKILQVSGIKYTYDGTLADAPDTDAVVGTPKVDLDRDGSYEADLEPGTTYRIVANSFLAGGGDGFTTLGEGENVFFGGLDIDALARTLEGEAYEPTPTDRITIGTAAP